MIIFFNLISYYNYKCFNFNKSLHSQFVSVKHVNLVYVSLLDNSAISFATINTLSTVHNF